MISLFGSDALADRYTTPLFLAVPVGEADTDETTGALFSAYATETSLEPSAPSVSLATTLIVALPDPVAGAVHEAAFPDPDMLPTEAVHV